MSIHSTTQTRVEQKILNWNWVICRFDWAWHFKWSENLRLARNDRLAEWVRHHNSNPVMVGVVSSIPTVGHFILCWNFSKSLDFNIVQKCQICQICLEHRNLEWFNKRKFDGLTIAPLWYAWLGVLIRLQWKYSQLPITKQSKFTGTSIFLIVFECLVTSVLGCAHFGQNWVGVNTYIVMVWQEQISCMSWHKLSQNEQTSCSLAALLSPVCNGSLV